MSSYIDCKSPTKCVLFTLVTLFGAIIYISVILKTYDQSIDGAQLELTANIRQVEEVNTRKRSFFVQTDQRYVNREKSVKDWLQEKPRDVIDREVRESVEKDPTKTNARNEASSQTNEEIKTVPSEKVEQKDDSQHNYQRNQSSGDSLPQQLKSNWADANFSLEFTANLDFGSGSYKSFWVRSKGSLVERLLAYNKAIDNIRTQLLSERQDRPYQPLSTTGSIQSLWCNRDDFHKELEHFPQVKTLALAWEVSIVENEIKWDSKEDQSNLILQKYYPWTGSNSLCNWINTPGFTKARWDAVYRKNCLTLENVTSSNDEQRLEPLYLHGKPINKNHYWPNHGLSYPKYFYNTTPPQVLYLHVLEDAVITNLGDVISGNLKLIPYSCSQDLGTSPPPGYQNSQIYDEVFIMGQYWGASFFHLMLENLPRIAPYISFLNNNPSILIHAQSQEGHTAKMIEVLALNRSRLIGGTVRARRVYLPQATPCGFAQIQSTQLLARLYSNHISKLYNRNQKRSILLIRRSGSRRFTQHLKIREGLESLAKEFDLKFQMFIDNPSPSMEEAMLMFRRAALIVAPHGAGLSNIIYSEPGTLVIEGVCNPPHVNMCYQWSAHILGHRYHGIASRRGCETWVDVDYHDIIDSSRVLLKEKFKSS